MTRSRRSGFSLVVLLGCATAPARPADSASAGEPLAANTPKATPGGAPSPAPAGWLIQTRDGAAVLTGPAADLRIAIVDADAKTADEAVATAWQSVHPGFKHALKLVTRQPARDGWEEHRQYQYEVSPNEKL